MPKPLTLVNRGPAGLLTKSTVSDLDDFFGEPISQSAEQNGVKAALEQRKSVVDRSQYAKDNIQCDGEVVDIASVFPDPLNARLHPERNMEAIMDSLCLYGQRAPLVVRMENRHVAAGNGRLDAMRQLGWTKVAVSIRPMTDAEFYGFALADNRTAELATWDFEMVAKVAQLSGELSGKMPGWSMEEVAALRAISTEKKPEEQVEALNLSERFVVPPFSVLDARQGYWQDRKRKWIAIGIKSEIGRGAPTIRGHEWQAETLGHIQAARTDASEDLLAASRSNNGLLGESEQARSHYKANATPGGSLLPAATLGKDGRTIRGDGKGKPLAATSESGGPGDLAAGFKSGTNKLAPGGTGKNTAWLHKTADGFVSGKDLANASPYGAYGQDDDTSRRDAAAQPQSGTSIFDPVVCELVYRWFAGEGFSVLDPFAGGSVRGVVAAKLGRSYTGVDLRQEQVDANEEQASSIVPNNRPTWVVGDSSIIDSLCPGAYDLVFSCPPYADLERYSDDPRDLSTMTYESFIEQYRVIIKKSCGMLRDNRFACFVVGDIRDTKTGAYRGFVADTIAAFEDAGLALYNDAVLVTAVGSLSIRVGRQFTSGRKLGKTHQNVLVFIKGDPRKAVKDCGTVDVADLDSLLSPDADESVFETFDPFE